MAEWADEITLITETQQADRINENGFEEQPDEQANTVFCNIKSVGYSEYYQSNQTGKVAEKKADVHKADYAEEDTAEINGRRYFILKTYEIDDDTIELTLTDLKHKAESETGNGRL